MVIFIIQMIFAGLGGLVLALSVPRFILGFSALFRKIKYPAAKKQHRFAVLVAAHDEENVISGLLLSLKQADYPKELLDVYLVADNCTDKTAELARAAGADVLERFNAELKGKSHAVDDLIQYVRAKNKGYDAYVFFDADNVAAPDFFTEINKAYDSGVKIATASRGSKNYSQSRVAAASGLCFYSVNRFSDMPVAAMGCSAQISGTGFYMAADIIEEEGGRWVWHELTEDVQFSYDCVIKKRTIGYVPAAEFFDEQPADKKTAYFQRLRWIKGFYLCTKRYGLDMLKSRRFSGYVHLWAFTPLFVIGALLPLYILASLISGFTFYNTGGREFLITFAFIMLGIIAAFYLISMAYGALGLFAEWKRIHCPAGKKLLYLLYFPVFILQYYRIGAVALFKKTVTWKKVDHTCKADVEEIRKGKGRNEE